MMEPSINSGRLTFLEKGHAERALRVGLNEIEFSIMTKIKIPLLALCSWFSRMVFRYLMISVTALASAVWLDCELAEKDALVTSQLWGQLWGHPD